MTNYVKTDYYTNSVISEKLNKVMTKYDVRYLKYLNNHMNKLIEFSEREILSDEEIEDLSHSLLFVSNNLKYEESIKKYTYVIDELSEVIAETFREVEEYDDIVNI